jgi:hypothetical protein
MLPTPRRAGPCWQADDLERSEATRTLRRTRCTNLDRRGNACNQATVPITECSAAGDRDKGPCACADDRMGSANANVTLGDRRLMSCFSRAAGAPNAALERRPGAKRHGHRKLDCGRPFEALVRRHIPSDAWSVSAAGMPVGNDFKVLSAWAVIDKVARSCKMQAPSFRIAGVRDQSADARVLN